MVGGAFEGEQAPLDVFGFQRGRPPHRDEAMLVLLGERGVSEHGRLPATRELVGAGGHHASAQGRGHPGDDHVTQPVGRQGVGDGLVVERAVEPHPRPRHGNRSGQRGPHALQESPGARGGMDVAGSERQPQAPACPPLAGEEGRGGGFAMPPLRDIAHGGPFLRSKHEQGRRIGIHDGAVLDPGARAERLPEPVVRRLQALEFRRTKPPQDGPQGIPMGELGQPHQGRDQPLGEETLGVLDPAQAGHQGEDVGQEEIGGMAVPVGILGPADVELEEVPEPQGFATCLKQTEAAEPGQPGSLEGEIEFPGAVGHLSQSYLKGSFVRRPFSPRRVAFA